MYYIDKIKQHFSNWKLYFLEHLLRFIFISFFVAIICFGFTKLNITNIMQDGIITEQHIILFGITLDNWSIFFTIVGVVLTAIWGIYQYDKNKSLKQQQNASRIAEKFSQNKLLQKCELVNIVIKASPLYDLINQNKLYDNISNFTISEVKDIYNDNFPDEYKKIEKSINFDTIYHSILDHEISIIDEKLKIKEYSTLQARKLFILDNEGLPFHFGNLIDDVLNELEVICMDISSQAAGEKYIYQSLHQTFLRTIKTLSIEICTRNHGKYSDKFYTNIIHVYNSWTKIYNNNLQKEKKRQQKAHKLLNPKIKTV